MSLHRSCGDTCQIWKWPNATNRSCGELQISIFLSCYPLFVTGTEYIHVCHATYRDDWIWVHGMLNVTSFPPRAFACHQHVCISIKLCVQCKIKSKPLTDGVVHYRDVIMSATASQITIVSMFKYRSKHKSKFRVTGLCEWNSQVTSEFPSHRPVTRKMFPFDDVTTCIG